VRRQKPQALLDDVRKTLREARVGLRRSVIRGIPSKCGSR
jgi:hypothetical protein